MEVIYIYSGSVTITNQYIYKKEKRKKEEAKNTIFPTTFFSICWSDKLRVVDNRFHMDSPTNISFNSIIHNLTFLQVVKNNCVCKFIL